MLTIFAAVRSFFLHLSLFLLQVRLTWRVATSVSFHLHIECFQTRFFAIPSFFKFGSAHFQTAKL